MSEFGLIEPFNIDDGTLSGVSPEHAFVLGVEWMRWRQSIVDGAPATGLVLLENASRIEQMLEWHGWFCEVRPYPFPDADGAICNQWREMWVGDKKQS